MVSMTPEERQSLLKTLWDAGVHDTSALAQQVGVSPRHTQRLCIDLGLRPKHTRPSIDHERLILLLTEGLVGTWIAEDLHVSPETVTRYGRRVPGHEEHVAEWNRVWQQIRRDPELLRLHYEIAPPSIVQRRFTLDAA